MSSTTTPTGCKQCSHPTSRELPTSAWKLARKARSFRRDVPTLNGPDGVAFCLTFPSPEGVSRENSGDRKRCGLRPFLTAAATSMAGRLLLRAFAASREPQWANIKHASRQDPKTPRLKTTIFGSRGLGVRPFSPQPQPPRPGNQGTVIILRNSAARFWMRALVRVRNSSRLNFSTLNEAMTLPNIWARWISASVMRLREER